MARSTVQSHSAHLRVWGFLLEGGMPTGVSLDPALPTKPEEATPLEWASSVVLAHSCPTCRAILRELARFARGDWHGDISMADLAALVGRSEWTVRAHLRTGHHNSKVGHSLVDQELVVFTPRAGITGRSEDGRPRYARAPDQFLLAPTTALPSTVRLWAADAAGDAITARLREETVWFDPTHPQAQWIVRMVLGLLRSGHPLEAVMARLNVVPYRWKGSLRAPYRWARKRLRPLLDGTARRSALAPDAARCRRCGARARAEETDGCPQCSPQLRVRLDGTPVTVPPQQAAYALAGPAITPPPF